jgi:Domain of unknown function (DUF397)
MTRADLSRVIWRKSSRSGLNGGSEECVEVAALDDGRIALRDSKHPNGAVLFLPRPQLATWMSSVQHNELT